MSKSTGLGGAMLDSDVWIELDAAGEAVKRAVPGVVMRYREAGTLTWALLHRMEDEVLAELAASGEHDASTLRMVKSSPLFCYPVDDRPVSFGGASAVPVVFRQIEKAWRRVH